MGRKCPPGVICIENITIIFIIFIIGIISYLFYYHYIKKTQPVIKENVNYSSDLISLPTYSYSNRPTNVLMNPHSAPLRNDNIYPGFQWDIPKIPINIPTQSVDSTYRQIGILTRISGQEQILPLMGKPLFTNRDKWNFYTMTDKNNMIKLPISYKGKSCTNEYGCDNIYNGDIVYVEGYNDAFKATIYDNDTMRYIPYL